MTGWTRRETLSSLAALPLSAPLLAGRAGAEPAPIDPKLFDGLLAEDGGAPGLGAAVLGAQGLKALGVAGVRRLDQPDPVTAGDSWHLGSNTKAMTAALYGRLVDQGKADWRAPVASLFPDLKVDVAWHTISIEQVLSHGGGILDAPLIGPVWLFASRADLRPLREQRSAFAQLIVGAPPAGPVGIFSYANANYILAGAVIERLANAPWEDAIKSQLFEPLGLTSAGFGAPDGAGPWGHAKAFGSLRPIDPSGMSDNPAAMAPAAGVHMALADYGRFLQLFLTGGGSVLAPNTVARLMSPQPHEGPAYALGWGVVDDTRWGQGPVLTHEGSNTFWHAVAAFAPARGLAFIGVGNANPDASQNAARSVVARLIEAFAT